MEYREVFPIEINMGYTEDNVCVVMMYDAKDGRNVPIIIGKHEADMILLEREGVQAGRPMTHELIGNILECFNLGLKEVTIDRFQEGIFYASMHISDGFSTKRIDARASDAIVVALRLDVPIMMAARVIEETGFLVDAEYTADEEEMKDLPLNELYEKLREYEEMEEYEKAAYIQKIIDEKEKGNR